jgi:hypothetical protein
MGGGYAFDETRVYRGKRSLHVWINQGNAGTVAMSQITLAGLDTSPGARKVTRWFMYLATPPLLMLDSPYARFQQTMSPWDAVDVHVDTNGHLGTWIAPANSVRTSATFMPPTGRWVCYELDTTFGDAGSGHVRVSMDDQLLDELDFDGLTNASPTMSNLIFGIYYNSTWNGQAYDMWIDEVYVANSPIGCAR